MGLVSLQKEERKEIAPFKHVRQEKATWAHGKKTAVSRPGPEVLLETDHVSTLILDFPPSEPRETNVCYLSLPVWGILLQQTETL